MNGVGNRPNTSSIAGRLSPASPCMSITKAATRLSPDRNAVFASAIRAQPTRPSRPDPTENVRQTLHRRRSVPPWKVVRVLSTDAEQVSGPALAPRSGSAARPAPPNGTTWRLRDMSILEKMTMLALGICSVGSLTGCGDNGETAESPGSTGEVGLSLQIPNGTTINTASYSITGPMGFIRNGVVDGSGSATLTALIGGIPAGTGYQISINATASDGSATCTGSAGFDVQARLTTSAVVPMTCLEKPRTGSVLVDGRLNICPTI